MQMAYFTRVVTGSTKRRRGFKGVWTLKKMIIPGHNCQICCGSEKGKLRSTFHRKEHTTCKMAGFNI